MDNGGVGYAYLGIPERLSSALLTVVNRMQQSLAGKESCAWAQLTSAALSRCVLQFASMYREHGADDPRPEVSCSEVFHLFAEQLLEDGTDAEWCVPAHVVPVVAGALAARGQLLVDRMGR
ncbi:hypothetical protein [Caballeronia sp. LZ032]|uniref:hypothetical protein n=1 Tax=Caballeronia sp. LZ032 TaxID=3038565 RepID=UPI002863E03B|nr:hypothetical protein [Caballeronia sp. LZ032]MDR5883941.1 hypothetical protein [Caballeronia sp. LZ032]